MAMKRPTVLVDEAELLRQAVHLAPLPERVWEPVLGGRFSHAPGPVDADRHWIEAVGAYEGSEVTKTE